MTDQLLSIPDRLPETILDLRYATTRNVTGSVIAEPQPVLQASAIAALQAATQAFAAQGYKIVIWDAYRTPETQQALLAVTHDQRYVLEESNHTKGLAVDATLATLDGEYLDMGTDFDDFSPRAHVGSPDISEIQQQNRALLVDVMQQHGFAVWLYEWWHFDFKGK